MGSDNEKNLSDGRSDGFSNIRYFMVPLACGKALDKVVALSGQNAVAWVLKLLIECASQQLESPKYCIDISTEVDKKFIAQQCHFESVDQFEWFVEHLCDARLFRLVEVGGKHILTSSIVIESADRLTKRAEAASKAANARWHKGDDQSKKEKPN